MTGTLSEHNMYSFSPLSPIYSPHGVLRPTGELLFRFPMAQIPKRLFGFPVACYAGWRWAKNACFYQSSPLPRLNPGLP